MKKPILLYLDLPVEFPHFFHMKKALKRLVWLVFLSNISFEIYLINNKFVFSIPLTQCFTFGSIFTKSPENKTALVPFSSS